MNALTVNVNYSDIHALTLPLMRHHFDRYLIVTDLAHYEEVLALSEPYNAEVFATDSFYKDGAKFRKWLALEEGLSALGREGWLAVIDSDIVWPKKLPPGWKENLRIGKLYTPLRRMYPIITKSLPPERDWVLYPVHRYVLEWGGYTHIFHSQDPVLGKPPWYQTNWRHAGGGDSYFQMKWSQVNKIRPPWECLHIGESGANWMGRVTRTADGSLPTNYEQNKKDMDAMYTSRRMRRGYENPIEKIL